MAVSPLLIAHWRSKTTLLSRPELVAFWNYTIMYHALHSLGAVSVAVM